MTDDRQCSATLPTATATRLPNVEHGCAAQPIMPLDMLAYKGYGSADATINHAPCSTHPARGDGERVGSAGAKPRGPYRMDVSLHRSWSALMSVRLGVGRGSARSSGGWGAGARPDIRGPVDEATRDPAPPARTPLHGHDRDPARRTTDDRVR